MSSDPSVSSWLRGSAFFFAQGSFYYEGVEGLLYNLFGIFLLMWADFFDCTDGQLARLTGKKSRLGRILDGTAGFVWFIPIYLVLVWRFYQHHEIEFGWLGIEDTPENTLIATVIVFILGNISGFLGMGGQTRLADYYIQVQEVVCRLHEEAGEVNPRVPASVRSVETGIRHGRSDSC